MVTQKKRGVYEVYRHCSYGGRRIDHYPRIDKGTQTKKGADVMASTEAQKRASAKYRQRNVKCQTVSFYPQHMDLYEWLRSQSNRNEYMRDLIRKDMEAHNQNEQK